MKDSGDMESCAYGAVMLYIVTVYINVHMGSQCFLLESTHPETQLRKLRSRFTSSAQGKLEP